MNDLLLFVESKGMILRDPARVSKNPFGFANKDNIKPIVYSLEMRAGLLREEGMPCLTETISI